MFEADPQTTEPNLQATKPALPAVTPPMPKRMRRKALGVLAAALLLVIVLSGSVLAAHGLAASAAVAPDVLLRALPATGALANAGQNNSASCNCAPAHTSYASPPFTPTGPGQFVLVSISKQQLWAFQNGELVLTSWVTTGMPQLRTPQGTFHVQLKEADVMFYSPWPYGSPFYYTPEHINYAMLFRAGGFYIHDAPWRQAFGPGTNVPHTDPDGTYETGSHGCVNMPTSTAAQLYSWIRVGATVTIVY
jgi:hypothetical protein